MFSANSGTHVLNMLQDNKPVTGQQGIYATAAFDKTTNEIILKLVNCSDKTQESDIVLQTSGKLLPKASVMVMQHELLGGINTIDKPMNIHPVQGEITIKGRKVDLALNPYSFSVVRVKIK